MGVPATGLEGFESPNNHNLMWCFVVCGSHVVCHVVVVVHGCHAPDIGLLELGVIKNGCEVRS